MIILIFFAGVGLGLSLFWLSFRIKKSSFEQLRAALLQEAELEIERKKVLFEQRLKEKEFALGQELNAHAESSRIKFEKEEAKIALKEEKLDNKLQLVVKKLSEIEKREDEMGRRKKEIEELAGLDKAEARKHLLQKVEEESRKEMRQLSTKIQNEMQENLDREAAKLLATAISRLALPTVSDHTLTLVTLPNDEMKARIVGREGRNIRTLEQLTGVNFVMDETPGAVCISGFDPMRKQIAKVALQDLIQDGRIHPTRIEEAVERAKGTIEKQIKEKGEQASFATGVFALHPTLIALLGKLSFRHSYGQNILEHSIEVAELMGLMAAELKLDIALAKRIGLLHDIGKAVSQETPGSHAIVGHDIALKCNESEFVANGIGCHHHEMPPTTIEASLCSTADQISGARPGARSEAIEQYIKRLGKLEAISAQYPGVEKAYALQAGREVKVIVVPEMISDDQTAHLAKTLAKRIEEELIYPGKIKVTVIREKKAVEYAS